MIYRLNLCGIGNGYIEWLELDESENSSRETKGTIENEKRKREKRQRKESALQRSKPEVARRESQKYREHFL